jgi:hypothetical protein
MTSPARLCIICKGARRLCGWRTCPLYSKIRLAPQIQASLKKNFFGPSTSVFVGHNFYPDVYVGPMAAIDPTNIDIVDSPGSWFGRPYGEILQFRSLLLRSQYRESVFSRSRFIEQNQELALAAKPTDVEILFKNVPRMSFEFSDISHPMGPSGTIDKFKVVGNPKVPRKVEKIVTDELKTTEASFALYSGGVDIYKLITILSSGIFGMSEKRKLVPTRWSITATHSMLANRLLEKIREYPSVNEYVVYSSEYLDNHYEILLMPGSWEYENFECWSPGSYWAQQLKASEITEEYEPFAGRSSYASEQGGGFYANRLGLAEGLERLGRQARCVIFREIHQGYTIPVGVWQCLENVRNAFNQPPSKFATLKEALEHISMKLKTPVYEYARKSVILMQKRLGDF